MSKFNEEEKLFDDILDIIAKWKVFADEMDGFVEKVFTHFYNLKAHAEEKEINTPKINIPKECYEEYGKDLDGCSTQELEGCGRCILANPKVVSRAKAACRMTISETQKEIHQNAMGHGWYDEPNTFGELIALCHSELSEALEDYREGYGMREVYYKENKPCGIPTELADVVIRIMDMCEYYGINLENAIMEKHNFNKTRPHKHGGKRL